MNDNERSETAMKTLLKKIYRGTVEKGINQARTFFYKEQRKSYGS